MGCESHLFKIVNSNNWDMTALSADAVKERFESMILDMMQQMNGLDRDECKRLRKKHLIESMEQRLQENLSENCP